MGRGRDELSGGAAQSSGTNKDVAICKLTCGRETGSLQSLRRPLLPCGTSFPSRRCSCSMREGRGQGLAAAFLAQSSAQLPLIPAAKATHMLEVVSRELFLLSDGCLAPALALFSLLCSLCIAEDAYCKRTAQVAGAHRHFVYCSCTLRKELSSKFSSVGPLTLPLSAARRGSGSDGDGPLRP